jgi:hypothetical protein
MMHTHHHGSEIVMMSDCTIEYGAATIVLSGATHVVHREAEKILRRFAHSATPYEVKLDAPGRIILGHPLGPPRAANVQPLFPQE